METIPKTYRIEVVELADLETRLNEINATRYFVPVTWQHIGDHQFAIMSIDQRTMFSGYEDDEVAN